MSNPVLVEVLRGGLVESRHRGAVAVVDADGATVLALGDVARPVYPRSAVKPLQALPLLESGAADRYGFGDRGNCARLRVATAASPRMSRWRAGCSRAPGSMRRARMRRALAEPSAVEPGAGALGRRAVRLAQQLLGQACGVCLRRVCGGRRSSWLRDGRASRAARGARRAGEPDRRRLERGSMRHRRLLDPDLGGAARRAGARVCKVRHRAQGLDRSAPRRRRASAPPARRSRISSQAPAASAPRS